MTKGIMHTQIQGPAVAVDTVVLGIQDGKLKTLILKIGDGEYREKWAVPGGLINLSESPEEAALRALSKKTNIKVGHLEQLYTFGKPDRDVRGQIISIAYFLLVSNIDKYRIKSTDFYQEIRWQDVNDLPEMAFDHKEIVRFAKERLQNKINYSNIAYSLLPKEFSLTDLQRLYETIWGKSVDKRNFRKRMLGLGLLEESGNFQRAAFRPAKLYRFGTNKLVFFE